MTWETDIATAFDRILAKAGKAVSYYERTPGAFSVTTGVQAITEVTVSATAICGDVTKAMIESGAAEHGDRFVMLKRSLLSRDPRGDDEVSIDSARWRVRRQPDAVKVLGNATIALVIVGKVS